MSLAYRMKTIMVTSKESYEDYTQQQFQLPPFCSEDQMKEITEKVLEMREWKKDLERANIWLKEINSENYQEINLETLTCTTYIKIHLNIVKEATSSEKNEKEALENLHEELNNCIRKQTKEHLETLQGTQELNEILFEVSKIALHNKAQSLGEILEITENKENQCYEFTIKLTQK